MIGWILFLGFLEDCGRRAFGWLWQGRERSSTGSLTRVRRRPALEGLEGRAVPAVTSAVVGGVLSVTSDFADPIVISSNNGQVLVNGLAPQSGAALASGLSGIKLQGGPGANLIDTTGVTTAAFTSLNYIGINTGGGVGDQVQITGDFPAQVAGGESTPADLFLSGTATNVGFDQSLAVPTAFIDGRSITYSGVTMHDNLFASHLAFQLGAGESVTVADDSTTGDGLSRLVDPAVGTAFIFRNPSQSLAIRAGSGQSQIGFNGLDPIGRPANLGFYGNSGSTLVLGGGNGSVSFDLPNTLANLDGVTLAYPGFGTVRDAIVAQNLAFQGGPGVNQVLSDDGTAADGFSMISVPSTGQSIDFFNPTQSLGVKATGNGSTLTFQGLDAVNRPSGVVLDSGTGSTTVNLQGSAVDAVFDDGASVFSLDGLPINLANFRGTLNDEVHSQNLTIRLAPDAKAQLGDGPVSGAGISVESNLATGRGISFYNPSNALALQVSGGNTLLTYNGIDPAGRPANINLDGGGTVGSSQLVFNGTATNVSYNLGAKVAWFDGRGVNFPNWGSVFDNVTATNLVIQTAPGVGQQVSDGATPGSGISRLTEPITGQVMDFRNPSTALTFQAVGNAPFLYEGLDSLSRPSSVTFVGSGTSLFSADVPGTLNTITYDETSGHSINFDGNVVQYVNYPGVVDASVALNRVFLLPNDGGKYNLSDNSVANDGISRLTTLPNRPVIDFRNPVSAATIEGGSGNDSITFTGLDQVQRPQRVVFDGGAGRNVFVHLGGAYPTKLSALHSQIVRAKLPKAQVSLF